MQEALFHEVKERYQRVLDRMARAARASGRDPESIRLVVVTKGHPLPVVRAAVAAGARILGENYAEEGLAKMSELEAEDVEWHMIGHIQSRKARMVVAHYDVVHSLDRLKLARRLDRFAAQEGVKLPVLLEFNLSGEETKFGFPAWERNNWPELAESLTPILELPHLDVCGLMTMPPFDPDPEATRPFFRRLRELRDVLAARFPGASWDELSMGMSHDFEIAIQEGATLIRVGTAIVGPRKMRSEG